DCGGDHTTALTVLNLGCIGVAIRLLCVLIILYNSGEGLFVCLLFYASKYPSAGVLAQDHPCRVVDRSNGRNHHRPLDPHQLESDCHRQHPKIHWRDSASCF
ncbi:hypothetical protein BCR33DRAFT_716114, partial [Rhizoclosmatium globosum]